MWFKKTYVYLLMKLKNFQKRKHINECEIILKLESITIHIIKTINLI